MSEGGKFGDKVGGGIGGIFKSIHGAGEALRGNINNALDGVGDGIANREKGSVKSHGNANENTADKGVAEFNEGVNAMKGHASKPAGEATSSTTTTTTTADKPAV